MVQGLRKSWVLGSDVVSKSANQYLNKSHLPPYWPYPSPGFKAYTYPTQINIDILGTETFHRICPAAGLASLVLILVPDDHTMIIVNQ